MELKNCKDFGDVFVAVTKYGADLKKAAKMTTTSKKKFRPLKTETYNEIHELYKNYRQHTHIIDTLLGIV